MSRRRGYVTDTGASGSDALAVGIRICDTTGPSAVDVTMSSDRALLRRIETFVQTDGDKDVEYGGVETILRNKMFRLVIEEHKGRINMEMNPGILLECGAVIERNTPGLAVIDVPGLIPIALAYMRGCRYAPSLRTIHQHFKAKTNPKKKDKDKDKDKDEEAETMGETDGQGGTTGSKKAIVTVLWGKPSDGAIQRNFSEQLEGWMRKVEQDNGELALRTPGEVPDQSDMLQQIALAQHAARSKGEVVFTKLESGFEYENHPLGVSTDPVSVLRMIARAGSEVPTAIEYIRRSESDRGDSASASESGSSATHMASILTTIAGYKTVDVGMTLEALLVEDPRDQILADLPYEELGGATTANTAENKDRARKYVMQMAYDTIGLLSAKIAAALYRHSVTPEMLGEGGEGAGSIGELRKDVQSLCRIYASFNNVRAASGIYDAFFGLHDIQPEFMDIIANAHYGKWTSASVTWHTVTGAFSGPSGARETKAHKAAAAAAAERAETERGEYTAQQIVSAVSDYAREVRKQQHTQGIQVRTRQSRK